MHVKITGGQTIGLLKVKLVNSTELLVRYGMAYFRCGSIRECTRTLLYSTYLVPIMYSTYSIAIGGRGRGRRGYREVHAEKK